MYTLPTERASVVRGGCTKYYCVGKILKQFGRKPNGLEGVSLRTLHKQFLEEVQRKCVETFMDASELQWYDCINITRGLVRL